MTIDPLLRQTLVALYGEARVALMEAGALAVPGDEPGPVVIPDIDEAARAALEAAREAALGQLADWPGPDEALTKFTVQARPAGLAPLPPLVPGWTPPE